MAREPSLGPEVLGALCFPGDAHLNPKRLVRAYKSAAEVLGVVIRRGETVKEIKLEKGVHNLTISKNNSRDKKSNFDDRYNTIIRL